MRVLFSLDKYQKSEGGADKLAKGIVDCLSALGYTIRVVQCDNQESFIEDGNVQLKTYCLNRSRVFRDNDYLTLKWNSLWKDILDKEIAEFKPDLMLTQNMLAPSSVSAAGKAGIKSLVFFHGYRCISPMFFFGQDALLSEPVSFYGMPLRHKLKWPLVKKTLNLYQKAYREADIIIANSCYISKVIEKFFERPAEVLYPVLDLKVPAAVSAGQPSNEVLFIKPQGIKGLEVFLRTAQLAPEKRFTVVGTASRRTAKRFSRYENITYLSWTDDMQSVYRNASVLFGPSQIPEPFGRVFVEAGLNYLPSVAADAGGIPEAVGQGGQLVDMKSAPEEWLAALDCVLENKKYSDCCMKARQNAEKILSKHNSDRLKSIVDSV
ncbi:MAG: glycosyltransferase [Planctomycetota bacterium]|jgi:glycosyltransferase involved in cell wall biosynthesis